MLYPLNAAIEDASLPICVNCSQFAAATPQSLLRLAGFGRCQLKPAWVAVNERTTCTFHPTRWQAAAPHQDKPHD